MTARAGIVVVSHSRPLADAAVALAEEMAADAIIEVAAGIDGGFGTDAAEVMTAIESAAARVDSADGGVLVLMDLGSAVLSADLAVEMLPDDVRDRVRLCSAPLVEGLVVAAVAAAAGRPLDDVMATALAGLQAKQEQIGDADPPARDTTPTPPSDGLHADFEILDPHGMHARPAARLASAVGEFTAHVTLTNLDTGDGPAPADQMIALMTLNLARGHRVAVDATGPDADSAVARVLELAQTGFGEV